jgi:hypothetical protein
MSRILIAALLAFSAFNLQAQTSSDYTVTVIPMDSGKAINAEGTIVGKVGNSAGVYGGGHASQLLGPGFAGSELTALSDNDYFVGDAPFDNNGTNRGIYQPLNPRNIIAFGIFGNNTIPTAVNSQGTAVGFYYNPSDVSHHHAFRYTQSSDMVTIDPPNSVSADAYDISESGYIVGTAGYPNAPYTATRWFPNGTVQSVPGPINLFAVRNDGSAIGFNQGSNLYTVNNTVVALVSDPNVNVEQISTNGRLVGEAYGSASGPGPFPFTMASPGAPLTYLPVPQGATGYVYDVNACGTIVGIIFSADDGTPPQAVMWTRPTCDSQVTPTVPSLTGLTPAQADTTLRQAVLYLGKTTNVSGSCSNMGKVVAQSLAAGSQAAPITVVDISVVTTCGIVVPGLLEMTQSEASSALQNVGLHLGSVTSAIDTSCNFIGTVMRQSPAGGTAVSGGSAVNITLGKFNPKLGCP